MFLSILLHSGFIKIELEFQISQVQIKPERPYKHKK